MGEWSIYSSSSGQVKATVKKLEYNGEFMGERSITATLYSPTPIDLEVGDYLTYRNEVFSIDYDPSILKQARNNTYGQGYVYDSVKFNSRQMELVHCKFLDYVMYDNQVHYSSLPTFSFYCETITNLTERIQANLNRLYTGGNGWTITVHPENVSVGRINIDIDGATCWDALALISTKFKSTFVIRGRTIEVAPSTNVLEGMFQYGKGNGLRSIARTSDAGQKIVTRLRAMGNTTNMPLNYYRNRNTYIYAPITEVLGPYERGADLHTTLTFNGCFTVPIEGSGSQPQYKCMVSLDKSLWLHAVFSANNGDVGYSVCSVGAYVSNTDADLRAFVAQVSSGQYNKMYFSMGADKDKWPSAYKEYTGVQVAATGDTRLMLPSYPDQTTDPYIDSANISKYGIREESMVFDGSGDLEDIYPTIAHLTAERAREAGATISLDAGDNGNLDEIVSATQITDDGIPAVEGEDKEMVSSFTITIKDIGFDINEYLASDNATISMRDGMCEGREFEITKVERSGNKYVLTCNRELDDSLNRYFPYDDYNLTAGDKFVLLNIEMPDIYIDVAAIRLQEAAEAYLAQIDHTVFVVDPKIDNIKVKRHDDEVDFAGTGTKIYDTIYEGMLMSIEDEDLDIDDAIFIDRLTIKEGESLIPEYEVVLRNEKTQGTVQQLQQQITDIKMNGTYGGNGNVDANAVNQLIKNYADRRYLRKDIIDILQQGVQLGSSFVSGLLGEGGIFRKEQDGTTYLEADKMYIRLKAYFDTVEIRKFLHSEGNRIASVAGGKCIRVEPIGIFQGNKVVTDENGVYHYKDGGGQDQTAQLSIVSYRCYFRGSDGDDEVRNNFVVGDLAYCHITSVAGQSDSPESKGFNQKHYWRLVVDRNTEGSLTDDGEYWIELSNKSSETITIDGDTYSHAGLQVDSDVPEAQDDIVQLGNIADVTRQGAIIEYVTGADAPSYQIYQGIDDFSLSGKNYIAIGYNTQTGRAYMNVYGDFFFGDKASTPTTYVKYNSSTKKLEIKAVISAQSPVSLDNNTEVNWQTFIRQNQNNWTPAQIESIIFDSQQFTSMEDAIEELQNQADGAIETWYFDADPPTLSNDPAVDWTTDDLKDQHIGDLYYSGTGNAYRFIYNDQTGTYSWVQLSDDAIAEALRIAREAQDTADGKRKIFVRQPAYADSYDIGDLWVNAYYNSGGVTYSNDILVAISPKAANVSFDIDDWTLSSKYTDDTYARNWITNVYSPFAESIQTQVDGKAETWRQASDPSSSWSTNDEKKKHVGDLWLDTSANGGNKTYIYQNTGTSSNPNYQWVQQAVPTEVFQKIDGKSCIYMNAVSSPPTNYKRGDLWILQENATINGVAYKDGDVLTASTSSETYSAAHWSKEVRYTGDEKIDGFISQILSGSGASGNEATVANMLRAIGSAYNNGETYTAGGLVLTNLINLGTGSISAGTFVPWAGISGEYDSRTQAQGGAKGNGIAAWYGGLNLDKEDGATQNYAKSLFRFDGSGYLANGNITWDEQGRVTIRDIYTLMGSNNTDILNQITTFGNLFHTSTRQTSQGSEVLIQPMASFTGVKVDHASGYVLSDIDVLNYGELKSSFVTKAFFESLFELYNDSTKINTNGTIPTDKSKLNIKAMFGFWTEKYISALGKNDDEGGGGGGASVLSDLEDVSISGTPSNGQVLTYQNGMWVNAASSGGLDPTAMWNALSASTNEQINASHLSTALSSYVTSTAMTNALANYLPLTGGTLSGGLSTRTITPASNSSYSLGSNASRWRSIYTTDVYSTYFSFHAGGYLQEESSDLMWHKGNGSYTVIHSGNIDDYATNISLSTTGSGNAFTSASFSNGTLTLTKGSTFLPLSGGTMTGDITLAGKDIILGTNSSSSNDSGDIIWKYGNGNEKARLWLNSATYTTKSAPNYRLYKSDGTSLYNGYLVLGDGTGASGTWGISINGNAASATKATQDGAGNIITSKYVTLDTQQTITAYKTFNAGLRTLSGLDYYRNDIDASLSDNGYSTYSWDTSIQYPSTFNINDRNGRVMARLEGVISSNGSIGSFWYVRMYNTSGTQIAQKGLNITLARGATSGNITASTGMDFVTDGNGRAFKLSAPSYTFGLHMGSGGTNRGIYEWSPGNKWLLYFDANNTILNHGNLNLTSGSIITNHDSSNHINGFTNAVLNCNNTSYGGIFSAAVKDGRVSLATYAMSNNILYLLYATSTRIANNTNGYDHSIRWDAAKGRLGIDVDPAYALHVYGTIYATGGVTTLSDMRFKQVIRPIDVSVEQIAKLPTFDFLWKEGEDSDEHSGTSAQAMQCVLPNLVHGSEQLNIEYGVAGTIIGILNSRKLVNHDDRIKALEQENEELRQRIKKLEAA